MIGGWVLINSTAMSAKIINQDSKIIEFWQKTINEATFPNIKSIYIKVFDLIFLKIIYSFLTIIKIFPHK